MRQDHNCSKTCLFGLSDRESPIEGNFTGTMYVKVVVQNTPEDLFEDKQRAMLAGKSSEGKALQIQDEFC